MGKPSAEALKARQVFLAKIKPGADETIKKNKEMLAAVQEVAFGIDEVVRKGQTSSIDLHITKAKALTAKVEANIAALDGCIAKVKDFAKQNKAVIAELDEVTTLDAALADERKKATTRMLALKSTQSQAEKALKEAAGSRTELTAQWALIERDARQALQDVLADVKKLYAWRDAAQGAAKSKDAKALADAKGKAEMLPNPYLSEWPGKLKKKLADFAARFEKQPQMDKNVLDQLASDKKELAGILERVALNAKLIDSVKGEVAALK
jgi:hypothetical protein